MTFIIKIETSEGADVSNLSSVIKDKAVDILRCDGIDGVTLLPVLNKNSFLHNKENIVILVARDGTVIQGTVSDNDFELIKLMISQHKNSKRGEGK